MKLSEAIMLNGMNKPQGWGVGSVGSLDAPCVIGGALQAIGKQTLETAGANNYRIFLREWPWVSQQIACPACGKVTEGTRVLWRLNDRHNWTRQQIAEWVQSVEPAEQLPDRFLPCEDDPPLSAGHCLKHGYYNGRFVRCPLCNPHEAEPQEAVCVAQK